MTSREHGGVVRLPADADGLQEAVPSGDVDFRAVGRTGVAALDPLVTATIGGETAFYPSATATETADAARALTEGSLDRSSSAAVVDHDPGITSLPTVALSGLEGGTRHVLAGAGWRRPATPDDHASAGGFVDADRDVVRERAAALLGSGWGDWCHDEPVEAAWQHAVDHDGSTAVVVNAHGSVADALLCESVPFEVLEGASLAAGATDADRIVVYCSTADETAIERIRTAVDAYPEPTAPIEVATGPDVYRAAEPTMALEAIEGNHRLEARLRTPDGVLPTLEGQPAVVHTARTTAQLAVAVRTGESPSTRLVTVTGDVHAPATVELREDQPLGDAVDAVELDGAFKAACVGDRFGGLTESLDVSVSPDALAAADLGTDGGIEVLADDECVLSFVGERTQFAADANCGRCVPCREGSKQLAEMLRDVYDGDLDRAGIEELVRTMTTSSVCGFGVAAGRPARTALASFADEVRAHADGRCPAGDCFDHAEVTTP